MENKVISKLSNEQIEIIADLFSASNEHLQGMSAEWLLSHAFQLGAKFYRDFFQTQLNQLNNDN